MNEHLERLRTDLKYFTQCVYGKITDPMDIIVECKSSYRTDSPVKLSDLEPCKPAGRYVTDTLEKAPAIKQKIKKGKQMSRYYDEYNDCYCDSTSAPSDTQESRNYFRNRISSIGCDKRDELMKQFGLVNDTTPDTLPDLVKRIQDGKYVIPKEYAEKSFCDPIRYIEWRDPSVKKDQDGFNVAWTSFDKESDKTRDAVMSQPFDKVAEAVQALETWTVPTSA